jgi:hypothetical protein
MADDYDSISDKIENLSATPPGQLADQMNKSGINKVAPNVAPHLMSTAGNALGFLQSKLPPKGNDLLDDHSEPSEMDKHRFMVYHKVISDPASVIDHIKDGSLNGQHMEALSTVYPDLHQDMKDKLLEGLADMHADGQKLDYHQRQAMSLFLGRPLDSTMTPQASQAIINSAGIQQAQRQQATSQKKASGVELKQINKVDSLYATPLQARAIDRKS